MYRFASLSRWLGAALLVAGLGACDVATDLDDFQIILQVDDLPIDFGAGGVTAPVRADRPTATSASVPTDFDVSSVNDLQAITLRPGMFRFDAGAAARGTGSGAPSGALTGYVFIGGVPIPGTPVTLTITDGAVTAVSPEVIGSSTSAVDRDAIDAFLAALPADERPALGDWQSLTIDQLRDQIRAALAGSTIPISFGLEVTSSDPDDPLTGSITLNEIDVSAVITR